MSRSPRRMPALPVTLVLGLLILMACTPATTTARSAPESVGYRSGLSPAKPYVMPDVTLTDGTGRPYNLVASPSKPVTLLFFGYTHCPDVCTTVLADVARALQGITAADRDQIQVVFVTTDPARDTSGQIRSYLRRFDPTFIGLTGPLGVIKTVAGRVGVDIEGMEQLPSGGYEVGHSPQVIGFARTSGVVVWTPDVAIGDLEHDFALLVDRSR